MASIYLVPTWFFSYSIVLEIVFALITAFVAGYSLKIYNICKEKEYKIFGIGFIFISISYIIWAFVNLFLLDKISDGIQMLSLQQFVSIGMMGLYTYMGLTIIGLVTLAYITLKTNNSKIYALILIISLAALVFSINKTIAFHVISLILIIFLVAHYLTHYANNRKHKNLLIPLAFLLLLASHIYFIFATNNYISYVMGHVTELIAYILILIRFILMIKKPNPKKNLKGKLNLKINRKN